MLKKIKLLSFLLLFVIPTLSNAQEKFEPKKTNEEQITIDGVLSPDEWKDAIPVAIDFEVNPANNLPAKVNSTGYITYTNTHLFIAFHAFDDPKNIRASVRSRDDFGMLNDDFVIVRFDTYADGRNNYLLAANPFGSQFDVRAINALTDEDRYDGSFNLDFETAGSIVEDGYQIEFKIPFSSSVNKSSR